ncbi:AlkA N-terminal domain-containing protein [Streptomyces sparsogenes]|uniref:AlkA N-terminal domain-containing protein n=1 Tax=Streptomyces sparsogenes TaxID=67365 RepID=UPI0034118068
MLDFDICYRAMASRDARFDGAFYVAVTSTGVYCRPVCGSRTPKRENVRFFRVGAAAEAAGFRACRRCRPEAGPSSPEWNVRGDLVARALRLIASGAVDEAGVAGVARQLAVSERHLHRQLVAEVGVGPLALALNRRAQTARLLIEAGALPLADVALAAGYSSIRQFNDGIRTAFGRSPSELRGARTPHDGRRAQRSGPLTLRLRYRPPLNGTALVTWLRDRAVPGVEEVDGDRYRRTLRLPRGSGVAELDLNSATSGGRDPVPEVRLRLSLDDLRDITAAVRRCRDLLDLDADPAAVADALGPDPLLGPLVRATPGLRVPGCAEGFELAVRVVVEQYAPLDEVRRLCGRLAAGYGEPVGPAAVGPAAVGPAAVGPAAAVGAAPEAGPAAEADPCREAGPAAGSHPAAGAEPAAGTGSGQAARPGREGGPGQKTRSPRADSVHDRGAPAPVAGPTRLFPSAAALAAADLTPLGLGDQPAAAVRALARAVDGGTLRLGRDADREEATARLLALPGIAPWAVQRIAAHALGDPDAFSPEDPGLRRVAGRTAPAELARRARGWRPWRSYAAMHLWSAPSDHTT